MFLLSLYAFADQWEQFSAEQRQQGEMLNKIKEEQHVHGEQMDRIEAKLSGESHGKPEITGRTDHRLTERVFCAL